MSKKLPTFSFEWVEDTSQFNKVFIKNYDEKSEVGYILEVDVRYPKELWELHVDLPFLPETKKLQRKVEKLIINVQDKGEYIFHIKSLKQAGNYVLILKKLKRRKLNQHDWLKPSIKMNNKLKTEAENDFEKGFFKLMNNAVFGKTMENMRKHRDIKLATT